MEYVPPDEVYWTTAVPTIRCIMQARVLGSTAIHAGSMHSMHQHKARNEMTRRTRGLLTSVHCNTLFW